MPNETTTPPQLSFDQLAHEASNEALCISIGLHVLQTLPVEQLDAAQRRALRHMEQSSVRLAELIDAMRSSHVKWEED